MSEEITKEMLHAEASRIEQMERELAERRRQFGAMAARHHGVAIGDVVEGLNGRHRGRVDQISHTQCHRVNDFRPWVAVRLLRKDGTPGQRLYGHGPAWRKVEG